MRNDALAPCCPSVKINFCRSPPSPQHFVLSVVHFGLEGSEGKRTLAWDNKHLIHVEICRNNQKFSSLLGYMYFF